MRSRYRLLPDVRSPQFQPSEHDADGRADVADLTVIAGLFGGGERLARSHIYLIASSAYCLGLQPVRCFRYSSSGDAAAAPATHHPRKCAAAVVPKQPAELAAKPIVPLLKRLINPV